MPQSSETAARFAIGSLLIGLLVLGMKAGAYWLTGSVALLSDALESTINVFAAGIAYLALRMSAKPADARHPYGHQKIEYIAAVFEGALIVLAAAAVFHSAYSAIIAPVPVALDPLGIGLNMGAAVINLIWAQLLKRAGTRMRSPVLLADSRHLMADVISSIGVIAALAAAIATGYPLLDPLIACAVAVNILVSGWRLMQDSFGALMDEAASPAELERIRGVIAEHAIGAIEAHDLKTRHSGRLTFVEFHLVVPAEMRVDAAHDICDAIENALRAEIPGVSVTIHVEPENKAKHKGIVVL